MKLLVCTNGNLPEWQACYGPSGERPRLPLPYAFGPSCSGAGFSLSALDLSGASDFGEDIHPFRAIYPAGEVKRALADNDVAIFWGTAGMRFSLADALTPAQMRKIAYLVYGWREKGGFTPMRRANLFGTRVAAHYARCIIAMTTEQGAEARSALPARIGVVPLSVGIDTPYYARPAQGGDVPEQHRALVEQLLQKPYVILPGDELRMNDDALDVVEATGLTLVRISQYPNKSGTGALQSEIVQRGLPDRAIVVQRIPYAFLRFLLQHASAYAGFIDATWQPVGWTVLCESLASGLPLVVYDGYAAREVKRLGLPDELCRIVPFGDRKAFARELSALGSRPRSAELAEAATSFAADRLDFQLTGPAFGAALRAACERGS